MGRRTVRIARQMAALAAVPLTLAVAPWAARAQDAAVTEEDLADGRVHYIASCARCHGVDGGGGEGPPLARAQLPRAPDDEALLTLIGGGIPGTGMSGSWWLSPGEQRQVAAYVRSLAPSADDGETLPGDPERGRAVYEAAGCEVCHTVGGFGTGRGPDLTAVGARRGIAYLREAVVDPAAALPRGSTAISGDFVDYLVVRVVDAGGRELLGVRMNEDSYTIQIKDARGVVHSFRKPDLRSLERQFDRSLMQSYRDRLSEEEIDHLISYLATLRGPRPRAIS